MDGDPLGTHRVIEPVGALPQPAWKLNNDTSKLFATEILLEVDVLNIDAASFRQMQEEVGSAQKVPDKVVQTVEQRGKQHNPVTGSGGMLLGRVKWVGDKAAHRGVVEGDKVATLASLSLTPLRIFKTKAVREESAQIDVEGEAIVFASAPFAKLPSDFDARVAVALLDVAGAAPQVDRLVKNEGEQGKPPTVVILGAGGKSGLLCAAQARRTAGADAKIIGIESYSPYARDLRDLGLCDAVVEADARDPLAVRKAVFEAAGGEADLSISCVNVEGVEMSAIIVTKQRGKVYFFSMTTSFSRAALGAEGVGKDIDLFIGNGYAIGHADHTLDLVRTSPALRRLMEQRYGG